MKTYLKNLLSLIKSFHSAWKAGYREDLVVVPESDLEDVKHHLENVLKEKNVCWDCVDALIAGGKACEYCAFFSDTCLADHYGETIGCDEWMPKDPEGDNGKPEAKP